MAVRQTCSGARRLTLAFIRPISGPAAFRWMRSEAAALSAVSMLTLNVACAAFDPPAGCSPFHDDTSDDINPFDTMDRRQGDKMTQCRQGCREFRRSSIICSYFCHVLRRLAEVNPRIPQKTVVLTLQPAVKGMGVCTVALTWPSVQHIQSRLAADQWSLDLNVEQYVSSMAITTDCKANSFGQIFANFFAFRLLSINCRACCMPPTTPCKSNGYGPPHLVAHLSLDCRDTGFRPLNEHSLQGLNGLLQPSSKNFWFRPGGFLRSIKRLANEKLTV